MKWAFLASTNYTDIHSQAMQVNIPQFTNLEIATGAYSSGSGQWLSLMEQAYGLVLMTPDYSYVYFGNSTPSAGSIYDLPTFYDGMIAAQLPIGQYYPAFKFITGHEVYAFSSSYNYVKDKNNYQLYNVYLKNDNSGNVIINQHNPLTPEKMTTLIDTFLAQNRVVVLGTPLDSKELNPGEPSSGAVDLPPGIVGTHAYAVLAHQNGMWTLRNPWGTDFTPAGGDSISNGYTMHDGVFQVPDSEVFKIFDQINVEQMPPYDTTPVVVNGQTQKNSNGTVMFTQGSSSMMNNFFTTNQQFIVDNYNFNQPVNY